jgi:hypothetical protein
MRRVASVLSAILVVILNVELAIGDDKPDAAIISRAGIPTPFPGILYTFEADAKLQAEREAQLEHCQNEISLQLGLQGARKDLATATTANALASLKKLSDDRIKLRDERISQLREQSLAEPTDFSKMLWFMIGAGVVIVGVWVAGRVQPTSH